MKTRLLFLFTLCSITLFGQDYHHWSEHYGARASLLGGAATSGLGDNGTVYYNPASMAFVEDPSLSVSVNAYKYRMRKLEGALGPGLDLDEKQFSTMPNLIAGVMAFEKAERLRLGYAVLTRRSFTSKFDYLHEANYDILSSVPGDELFIGAYNMHHQLSEYWAGFGLSYRLSDGFAIGFSHFGIYRDVKYSNSHNTTVLPPNGWWGEITSLSTDVTFNYWNIKGLFKPSISLTVENFKFGIAFTTPSFNMLGKADVYREFEVVNLDEVAGLDYDFTVVDRVEGVKTVHKENGALAFGVSWRLGKKAWLHFTNETFFGGKYYMIFDSQETPNAYPEEYFNTQTIREAFGDQTFTALGEETEAVTNLGIGLESKLGKRWEMYLGARTDFMYNEQPYYGYERIGIDASKNHNYHFSLGLVHITKKNKRYTVGVEYGHSPRENYINVINFTTPELANGLIGYGSENAVSSQHSFKLIAEITLLGKKENGK